jgi:hypothetical protein
MARYAYLDKLFLRVGPLKKQQNVMVVVADAEVGGAVTAAGGIVAEAVVVGIAHAVTVGIDDNVQFQENQTAM